MHGHKNFDLLVVYFGEHVGMHQNDCDIYRAHREFKWPLIVKTMADDADIISRYECVAFPDEDLKGDANTWSTCFDIFHEFALDLAAPSMTGHLSHGICHHQEGTILRFTNFVEIQAPMFSQRALKLVAPTFTHSVSGWGLDLVWPAILSRPTYRTAIIDSAPFEHTRPCGGGALYKLLSQRGIDPGAEMWSVCARYNVPPVIQPKEYSKVIPLPCGIGTGTAQEKGVLPHSR